VRPVMAGTYTTHGALLSKRNESKVNVSPASAPSLPELGLRVDYGAPAPGSSKPMPDRRRATYVSRIRNSVEAQAAGAEKASQLFIK
jgi:hypothetical protein